MKENDLHMSDGEVRTPCTSPHCSARQISCVLFLPKIVAGSNSLRLLVAMCWKKLVTDLWKRKASTKKTFGKLGHGDRERSEQYNRIRARSARNMLYLRSFCGSRALIMGVTTPMARCQEDSLFICTPCFILL